MQSDDRDILQNPGIIFGGRRLKNATSFQQSVAVADFPYGLGRIAPLLQPPSFTGAEYISMNFRFKGGRFQLREQFGSWVGLKSYEGISEIVPGLITRTEGLLETDMKKANLALTIRFQDWQAGDENADSVPHFDTPEIPQEHMHRIRYYVAVSALPTRFWPEARFWQGAADPHIGEGYVAGDQKALAQSAAAAITFPVGTLAVFGSRTCHAAPPLPDCPVKRVLVHGMLVLEN
jgi:hypothetical protein